MIEDTRFLGGYLVGIGIKHATGESEYRELDKPIHNRITSVGLDHLLRAGGSDDAPTEPSLGAQVLWVGRQQNYGAETKWRSGALDWMAFGSGTSATKFSDTALESKIGQFYRTKYAPGGYGQSFNGTHIVSFGNYSFRVSHQSAAVSATTTVNELGWFGGYGTSTFDINNGATPVLFARVVLPEPVTLQTGDALITTYQLDESNSNTTATAGADFFGLKDANGNTLQFENKLVRKQSYSDGWNCNIGEPWVTTVGTGGGSQVLYFVPAYENISADYSAYNWAYTLTSGVSFPAEGTMDFSGQTYFGTENTTYSTSILAYTGVGSTNKYRDRTFVTGAYNPGMANNPTGYKDITAITFNGMAYRFGYYENGVWTPQAWRKYANKQVTFTFRTRYSTADTTL